MRGKSCNTGLIVIITTIFFNGCIGDIIPVEVTNSELEQLAETIFNGENPDLQNAVQINLQGRISRGQYRDIAPLPLITVDPPAIETPVIQLFRQLFDNYELNTLKAENVTDEERDEENNFIEALLNTEPIDRVMNFLSEKGYIAADDETYRETLRNVWFTQYVRQKSGRKLGSSAFEHSVVGEMKAGKKFMGLHNWISFHVKEASGALDYWGYRNAKSLGNRTSNRSVILATFSYSGKSKSSSFFVGTSPEHDISLYTFCYFVRPNRICQLSLGGTKVKVQTYTLDHKKKGVKPSLGSAFIIL